MNDVPLSGCLLPGSSHLSAPPAAGNGLGDRQPERGNLPLIAVRDLAKSVANALTRTYLLRHITLAIEPGEFLSIMGPAGAGKSTLLNILAMCDADFEGEYELDGNAVHAMPIRTRASLQRTLIGVVQQTHNLLEDLTLAENVEVPLRYRDIPKHQRDAAVLEALERFNLTPKKELRPSQLCGSEQQLAAFARAIVAAPRILFVDEPAANLHDEQSHEIMTLLGTLHRAGMTIVQVTHSESIAAHGNRIVRLRDGWIAS